ncbi:hypothetical protein [Nocardia blacklockiae]|uniref:hypothetical protein n=1 Tax=Nocardia blacklockiae TaxID=480036 RepID=UPI00189326DC|nr:hypothetical protein [Nocardia blacklockiae]MBF6171953.1 hypothetical protein [Nocardia blacklockiae]
MSALDPVVSPMRMIAARAGRKGFRLEQTSGTEPVPGRWHVLELSGEVPVFTGSLDEINDWLGSCPQSAV